VTRNSYADAVFHFDSGKFDFVVVDQGGPLFRGRCVLERVSRLGQPVPVLVLTDWADMRIYLDAMELGALDYLEKAPGPSKLLRVITVRTS
jgi:DNA-binding response OmpR family regulator